jgi:hypothetical protein
MMIKMLVVCCRVYEKGKANVTFVAKLADDLTTFCGAGYENYLFCEICGWIVVIITHCKD